MSRAATAGDGAAILAIWQHVLQTGSLPAAAVPVRSRLVRAVGRIELPSGPAFLKVMAFPRARDRWRYLLRALPAAAEARWLQELQRAGIPAPEVLAVHGARRAMLPHRSLLVLRALPVIPDAAPPERALADRAAVARRLLDASLFHPDLNPDNFVRLQGGRLAVLDVQSMRSAKNRRLAGLAMAARLVLDAPRVAADAAIATVVAAGLAAPGDADSVERRAARIGTNWLRARIHRCWQTSTEFVRERRGAFAVEHRRRDAPTDGRWVGGGRELDRAWEDQRLLEVLDGRSPRLFALRTGPRWFPGARAVYVPASVDDNRVRDDVRMLSEGGQRLRQQLFADVPPLRTLQSWRARAAGEVRG